MLDPLAMKLERYLDTVAMRQRVVAGNIANADTPGYRTRDVDFRTELERASGAPQAIEVAGLAARNDGNNVSLDREARLLAENALRFQSAAALLRSHMRQLRTAIQEGKGV